MANRKLQISSKDLRRWRKRLGLSQQDVARILNVGVATISRWENGEFEPTGTAGAILATLASGRDKTSLVMGAAVESGRAIFELLKEHFESPAGKKKPRKRK